MVVGYVGSLARFWGWLAVLATAMVFIFDSAGNRAGAADVVTGAAHTGLPGLQ